MPQVGAPTFSPGVVETSVCCSDLPPALQSGCHWSDLLVSFVHIFLGSCQTCNKVKIELLKGKTSVIFVRPYGALLL